MSVQAMSWVIEHSPHKGSDLLCLVMVANYASADGSGAFPSYRRLARDCRMSERQVVRIIQRLEAAGALAIERRTGRGHTNLLRVIMAPPEAAKDDTAMSPISEEKPDTAMSPISPEKGDKLTDFRRERVTPASGKGDKSHTKGDTAMSPDPLIEPSLENQVQRTTSSGEVPRPETPFGLYAAFLDLMGFSDPGGAWKTKQLGAAKTLLKTYAPEDVLGCARYLRAWRDEPFDLTLLQAKTGNWVAAGRPAQPTRRADKRRDDGAVTPERLAQLQREYGNRPVKPPQPPPSLRREDGTMTPELIAQLRREWEARQA